jgi:transcriptional regulator with GAF, ATPase, and Fis domain
MMQGGVAASRADRRVTELVAHVADTDSPVLLLGEIGSAATGLASQIHKRSTRWRRPMVCVSCAAIPPALIERELFGWESAGINGALARIGQFEFADQSTIFLDGIGDLPLDAQVRVLRVLEEGRIERLGSARSIGIDTRIIAATHRDLRVRIAEGAFREDLYYRLAVFPIRVPARSLKLIDVEKQHLKTILESAQWRIRGERGAAARLGLTPATLERRMARLGLKRPAVTAFGEAYRG